MPFYFRSSPPLPLWQPPAGGAAVMLIFTAIRSLGRMQAQASGGPSVPGRLLYVLGFTLLGGMLAGGTYWALQQPQVRRRSPVYAATLTLAVFLALVAVLSAAAAYDGHGGTARLYRPEWFVSTLIVAAAVAGAFTFAWLPRRDAAARVYLAPADYNKLSPEEQARLHPAPDPK